MFVILDFILYFGFHVIILDYIVRPVCNYFVLNLHLFYARALRADRHRACNKCLHNSREWVGLGSPQGAPELYKQALDLPIWQCYVCVCVCVIVCYSFVDVLIHYVLCVSARLYVCVGRQFFFQFGQLWGSAISPPVVSTMLKIGTSLASFAPLVGLPPIRRKHRRHSWAALPPTTE